MKRVAAIRADYSSTASLVGVNGDFASRVCVRTVSKYLHLLFHGLGNWNPFGRYDIRVYPLELNELVDVTVKRSRSLRQPGENLLRYGEH